MKNARNATGSIMLPTVKPAWKSRNAGALPIVNR